MRRLLVVDDDADLRQLLSTYLSRHGYDVLLLPNTEQLDAYLDRYNPHLVILDLMMPGEDGLAACRRLRGKNDTDADHHADRARRDGRSHRRPRDGRRRLSRQAVRAARTAWRGSSRCCGGYATSSFEGAAKPFAFGPFECNFAARQLTRNGMPVPLTGGEFVLLCALIRNANRPLKRERLLELTRGGPVDTPRDSLDRAIDMQIYRLRRAIEDDPAHPRHIRTIWGVGYVFVPNADAPDAGDAPAGGRRRDARMYRAAALAARAHAAADRRRHHRVRVRDVRDPRHLPPHAARGPRPRLRQRTGRDGPLRR